MFIMHGLRGRNAQELAGLVVLRREVERVATFVVCNNKLWSFSHDLYSNKIIYFLFKW